MVSSPRADALERVRAGVGGRQDLDGQARGVVLGEVLAHLGDDLRVVRTGLVEPEHHVRAGEPAAQHREAHPVAHRRVLHLARAPDVARLDLVREHDLAGAVHDPHRAVDRDLERLVVRAVLLGLLRHEADVGHRTHRRGVERAVRLAVAHDRVVHTGVATSRG